MDKAQSVVKLMKALREHNEKYPDAKRTLGYSIEGGYARKSADGHYVARVINVAITPIPVDCTSYVEQTTKANRAMQKSLAAGYATSPEGQADGGALRKQSIEGAKNNISQGGSEMEKFGSKDECYKHHVTKGLAAEEAKKKAEEWEAAQAQKATVENAAAEIDREGHDLSVVLLAQPGNGDRCIESTGIGKHYLLHRGASVSV